MGATAHQSGTVAHERVADVNECPSADPLVTAAERLHSVTCAAGVAIALDVGGEIVCRASIGTAPEVGTQLGSGAGLSATCVRTGAVVCCADTSRDPRADAASCNALNIRSAIIAPVIQAGTAIGLVACFWAQPRAFDDGAVAAVSYVAGSIAPAAAPPVRLSQFADTTRPRRPSRVAWTGVLILAVALAIFYGWQHWAASRPATAPGLPRPPLTSTAMSGEQMPSTAVREPVLLSRVEPDYPAGALARATEREVALDVTVDREGRVADVKIVSGDPILAIAAAGAVTRWRYQPISYLDPGFHVRTRVVLRVP